MQGIMHYCTGLLQSEYFPSYHNIKAYHNPCWTLCPQDASYVTADLAILIFHVATDDCHQISIVGTQHVLRNFALEQIKRQTRSRQWPALRLATGNSPVPTRMLCHT